MRETPALSSDADSGIDTNLKRKRDLSKKNKKKNGGGSRGGAGGRGSSLNKQSYQQTVLFNSSYFRVYLWLQSHCI